MKRQTNTRLWILGLVALLALPASTATALEIEFDNPLFAFDILSAKPGVTSRTQDGWHIFEEVDGKDMLAWIFTPKGHGTFPTVIKRLTFEKGGAWYVETAIMCGGTRSAFDRLHQQYQQLDAQL